MRKFIMAAVIASLAIPTAPALAKSKHARYDRHGRYVDPRPIGRNDRVWRGKDGHYYCERENGTTGLIIGGAVGALLGRQVDGGQDKTLGTVLGAAGGALLGREIDGHGLKCR